MMAFLKIRAKILIKLVIFFLPVIIAGCGNDGGSDSAGTMVVLSPTIEPDVLDEVYSYFQTYYLFQDAVRPPENNETIPDYVYSYHSVKDIYTEYLNENVMTSLLDSLNIEDKIVVHKYEPDTLYINFTVFAGGTARRVSDTIDDHIAKGYTKLILDLRLNTGGYPDEAAALVDYFTSGATDGIITKITGPAISEIYRLGEINLLGGNKEDVFDASNMVVLTSGMTASAAEILIGGLTHFNEATQIGSTTFGKNRLLFVLILNEIASDRNDGIAINCAKIFNAGDADSDLDREGIGYTPINEPDSEFVTHTPFLIASDYLDFLEDDPLASDWHIPKDVLNNLYSQAYWRGFSEVAMVTGSGKLFTHTVTPAAAMSPDTF